MKKLNKNNKGYSLVELIVTITILSFVGAVIAAFVGMSMNSFRSNSAEVNVQYQAQLAANQMGNAILSATSGMAYDEANSKLEVYSYDYDKKSDEFKKYIKTYTFVKDDADSEVGKIVYREKIVGADEPADEVFANFITNFDVVITGKDGNKIEKIDEDTDASGDASKVEITLGYKNDNKEYTERNIVTLRNEIKLTTSADTEKNAEEFFKDVVPTKYTRVNNVDFTTEPGKNYLWVGKQYTLAETSGSNLDSAIVGATDSGTIIKNAEFNISNPKEGTKYGFNWSYGVPGPNSTEAFTDEEQKIPNIVASGNKIMVMVGADETSPFQVVGTSIESLPDQTVINDENASAEDIAREKSKRAKTDSVMIYPKHISGVSITSTADGDVMSPTLAFRVGITVKYAGPEEDIDGNRNDIKAALKNGESATTSKDAEGKRAYTLSNDGAIACFLTEIHDEKQDGKTVTVEGTPTILKLKPITVAEGEKDYTISGDSVTYYFETEAPYSAGADEYQRYKCTVVGNTLGLNVERPANANANLKVDINKCILGFDTTNIATRLCAGESVTLTPQLTVRSTKEDIPLTVDGANVKLSVSAALKGNVDIGTENIGQFCTFDASTGQIKINDTLDGSYSMTIKVEYKKMNPGLIRIYADAVDFDILKEDGSQFLTQKEAKSQNYEFIPVGVDLPITMRVYSAGDIKKKPMDTSKYVLRLAEDCNSPANWTGNAGSGCTLNFFYNNTRYKGTLKLELCRYNENGTTEDEKYHRLGIFKTLNIVSDNYNVGLINTNKDTMNGEKAFVPTEVRSDWEYGNGQKTSERYSEDKRINIDFYWFYDVFGNAVGYNSVATIDTKNGKLPLIKVKLADGSAYNCYKYDWCWIREGY